MDPAADLPQARGSLACQQHLREVAGAAASQVHRLGQQWVTGSSPFQGHLAGVFRLHSSAVSAVWGVWENSHFSVSMKPSQDVYSLRPSMTT